MKFSELSARIEKLEAREKELAAVKAMHFTKRPEPWVGRAEALGTELDQVRRELKELWAWKRGNWYEDDIGAGGGPSAAPSRSVR